MTMRAAFLPFLLIAAHVSAPVDCKSRSKTLEELRLQQSVSFMIARMKADTPARRTSAGSIRKHFHGHFLVVHPIRTHKKNYVSVFDLRRKPYVRVDSEGERYNFRQKNRNECLFSHIGFNKASQRGVFDSPTGNHPSSRLSSISLNRFLAPLVRRQRRSEEVNPSDPLRSESHPSHSVNDPKDPEHGQPEPDQTGAVSKETINSSDDDPLKVLHANGPVSPVKTNRAEQD
ncbi:uncharacterized protein LOC144016798 [Festucalex cinctus]